MNRPISTLANQHISTLLLDLFVNSYLLQVCVELLQLKTLGVVLLVLGRDIAAGAWYRRVLLLGALQDYLDAVAFLCHCDAFKKLLIKRA